MGNYKLICLFLLISLFILADSFNRIVVLDPAIVETIFLLNGQNKIVAIAHSTMTPIEPVNKTPSIPSVGLVNRPSIERILSFRPDLVIVNNMNEFLIPQLNQFRIRYEKIESNTLNELAENILRVGSLVNRQEEAKLLYEESKDKVKFVKNSVRNKPLNLSGTFIYNANPIMAFNNKSIRGEILNLLGVDDLAKEVHGERPILSTEYIIKKNPDFLIGIKTINSLDNLIKSNPYLRNLKLSKNIYILSSNRIMRLSPFIFDEILDIYNFLSEI